MTKKQTITINGKTYNVIDKGVFDGREFMTLFEVKSSPPKEEINKIDDIRAEWNGVDWIPKKEVLNILEKLK